MSKLRPILGFASSPGGGIELEASWPAIWGQLERLATHHTYTYQQPPGTCLTILKVYHTKVILTQRKIRCRPICTKLFHSLFLTYTYWLPPLPSKCRTLEEFSRPTSSTDCLGYSCGLPDEFPRFLERFSQIILFSWQLSFWYSILYSWCRKTDSMDSMNRLILW